MDWLSTGHKFAQRYGHASSKYEDSERSPIFLQVFLIALVSILSLSLCDFVVDDNISSQFMDATWQLLRQFPSAFEFHEYLLLYIMDQVRYESLFYFIPPLF